MEFKLHLIDRSKIWKVWETIQPGLQIYREKSPHYVGSDTEVFKALIDSDGDRLVIVSGDRRYMGFLTFRTAEVEGEQWGTLGMIYMTAEAQRHDVLASIGPLMQEILRSFGCGIMNYMTARKGFAKLAPKLGFRPRLIEWMKEI